MFIIFENNENLKRNRTEKKGPSSINQQVIYQKKTDARFRYYFPPKEKLRSQKEVPIS